MNRMTKELHGQYARRFVITAAAVAGAAVSDHLIRLGYTGGHLMLAIVIAIVCIWVGWTGTRDLHRRWMRLRQLHVMHEAGPFDHREHVPPEEAARHLGDRDGPNMWA